MFYNRPQANLSDICRLGPVFALSHHFLVWLAADEVYLERKCTNYALLGDDIVIADKKEAECYFDMLLG
jgi:hypothetical protein